jgi:predicted nucleotide-binding protein
MARRVNPKPVEASPLELRVSQEDAESKISDRIAMGRELLNRAISSREHLEAARKDYSKRSDYNKELLNRLFSNDTLAREYSAFYGAAFSANPSLQEKVRDFHKDVGDKINRLESIKGRLDLIPVSTSAANVPTAVPSLKPTGKKVFVVHGHDEGAREATARFLERLGLQPIVLHEMPSGGRTIIEKLEQYSDVDFAVVLLTPDDVGAVATAAERLSPRARQNVMLELGFFVGKLGRDHVCALHKGAVELPSDFFGVVYVPMDDGNGWKVLLAKELREAGFDVDLNSAL